MSDLTAKVGLATSLEKQGKFKEAEVLFKQVLSEMSDADPHRADVLAAIGGVLLMQKGYEEAEEFFGEALLLLAPQDVHRKSVLAGLAASCINQGKDVEAESFYREALNFSGPSVHQTQITANISPSIRHASDDQLTANLLQGLPSNVRDDVIESQACLQNKCWNAFGAMARRTVHSICADLGCSKGDLKDQIDELCALNRLKLEEANSAHEIRTLGRNGAHPEWEPVTEEMATSGWGLLIWLCKRLYEQPPASPNWSTTTTRRYRFGNPGNNP
ncbi:MAG TPA: DUF4145 domain-containing protein [Candidatus Melainabacteria bacterium]|jgi:tetratricopeptide (TPR) repeat protein|nr:DUF4145 domain-containing protein [Candidatus Melainabacteria bacterium]HIN66041.1 DUF4145 domain-containing protein [Candidatus Obscuribacterales bacterium]